MHNLGCKAWTGLQGLGQAFLQMHQRIPTKATPLQASLDSFLSLGFMQNSGWKLDDHPDAESPNPCMGLFIRERAE